VSRTTCFAGIDIGSVATKIVLLDAGSQVICRAVRTAAYGGKEVAEELLKNLLTGRGLSQDMIACSIVTGYGRVRFTQADAEVSEITCHARGAFHLCPKARTVVDIGGQDSKVIQLDNNGRVVDFALNDRCAAGTGRFLEVMAQALDTSVEELGAMASRSVEPLDISNTCTVFAQSEAVSHLARGAAREDVAAGLHRAVASRVLGLVMQVGLREKIALTGGVALNRAFVQALSALAAQPLLVVPDPQVVGALGAALEALKRGQGR